jgi:multidrug efflux pump subunit AcrB
MIDDPVQFTPPTEDVVEQTEQVVSDAPVEEVQQVATVAAPTPPQEQEVKDHKNFRALREQALRLEQEKNEMARQLAAIQSQFQNQPKPEEPEQEDNLAPDALVEKRHLSRYDKKIKALENQLKQYQEQSVSLSAESQLKSKYPDFDSIVNKDNLEMLKLTYPELAQTIYNNPDLYTKGASAYTIIKQMGIAPGTSQSYEKDRAEKNLAKPRPLASVAASQGNNSPLERANAFANGLTEELRAQLRKEMIESMRNL